MEMIVNSGMAMLLKEVDIMSIGPSEQDKEQIMDEFTGLLPMLRARLGMTQEDLGKKVGTTRQTIIAIENKKRRLTWAMFLSLVFVFFINPNTRPFLMASDTISKDLSQVLFGSDSMLTQAKEFMDQEKE